MFDIKKNGYWGRKKERSSPFRPLVYILGVVVAGNLAWSDVMREFTDMELLFLHRILTKRTDEIISSIQRVKILIERGMDKYERLAVLESELKAISSLRERVVEEIAIRFLLKELNS